MLQVTYSNCPAARKQSRDSNEYNRHRKDEKTTNDDAWKKEFANWVLIKVFKKFPESEQIARQSLLDSNIVLCAYSSSC